MIIVSFFLSNASQLRSSGALKSLNDVCESNHRVANYNWYTFVYQTLCDGKFATINLSDCMRIDSKGFLSIGSDFKKLAEINVPILGTSKINRMFFVADAILERHMLCVMED